MLIGKGRSIDRHNGRFRELTGSQINRDSVERDVNNAMKWVCGSLLRSRSLTMTPRHSETENGLNGAENVNSAANGDLQAADTKVTFTKGKCEDLKKEAARQS